MTDKSENIILTNIFGMVTDKRVTLHYKSGTEDIPIEQITSISFLHKRNLIFAAVGFFSVIVFFVLLIVLLVKESSGLFILLSVVLILFGFLTGLANWVGHHVIIIHAEREKRKPLKVEMSRTKEGKQFVDTIKKLMSKKIPLHG